jgi:TonB family protein
MKNYQVTLLLSLLIITGFAQNTRFQYSGRLTPAINKTILDKANFILEIMPEFSKYFVLPFNEQARFDKQLITIYPQGSIYPQDNFKYLISYVSVDISTICNGKVLSSQNSSDILTSEQKTILVLAEPGTDIKIKIKFRFNNEAIDHASAVDKIKEGEYVVTVIPQTEAEYPGGFNAFSEYFIKNVFNIIPEQSAAESLQQAVLKFTISEEGQIVNARMSKTSTDPKIDELILEATNKMPRWMPAQNSKGMKIKQEFSIPLGGGGC